MLARICRRLAPHQKVVANSILGALGKEHKALIKDKGIDKNGNG